MKEQIMIVYIRGRAARGELREPILLAGVAAGHRSAGRDIHAGAALLTEIARAN